MRLIYRIQATNNTDQRFARAGAKSVSLQIYNRGQSNATVTFGGHVWKPWMYPNTLSQTDGFTYVIPPNILYPNDVPGGGAPEYIALSLSRARSVVASGYQNFAGAWHDQTTWTVETTFMVNALPAAGQVYYLVTSGDNAGHGCGIAVDSNGHIYFYDTLTNVERICNSLPIVAPGTWYMVQVLCTAGSLTFYLTSPDLSAPQLMSFAPNTLYSAIALGTYHMNFGAWIDGSFPLNGAMGYVAVNRATAYSLGVLTQDFQDWAMATRFSQYFSGNLNAYVGMQATFGVGGQYTLPDEIGITVTQDSLITAIYED